jgi:hypothetical protein
MKKKEKLKVISHSMELQKRPINLSPNTSVNMTASPFGGTINLDTPFPVPTDVVKCTWQSYDFWSGCNYIQCINSNGWATDWAYCNNTWTIMN